MNETTPCLNFLVSYHQFALKVSFLSNGILLALLNYLEYQNLGCVFTQEIQIIYTYSYVYAFVKIN